MMQFSSRTIHNDLLASLPADEYRRISSQLTTRPLKPRDILQKRDEPLGEVYFPGRSLCSLFITMSDGASAEIAVVGAEGLIGLESVQGLSRAACDATVHVAGDGICHVMSEEAFRRELDHRETLYSNVTLYAQAVVGFLMQSVACNGLHSADARCCRWLLHAQDRLKTQEFPLTHELLATMLAVRRPTVTLVIADLVRLGIISTSRGHIKIADRTALEARACECYKTVKGLFNHLLPVTASGTLLRADESWHEPTVLVS
jgi:CRP-like cAMP-binding protein